ncbi:helix-turn-helix domain-containing protein [Amycolatopsis sp. CA-230715]|uniref:helix-turn-helix domain-containing protein n=1 Tax=Amycolatopsis sp. CA-230715 TaxID=2745196 RepID=UPI001C0379DD|nr:helix-turn-helix transcriptional regulator [Amycolatopsis sp. CA-230715]QWF85887.1 hypothetical protein HUW46_09367 [Amycolatopsis sp. CA-230715]
MSVKRQRLARARRAAGYTQESLATQLGVDPTTVSKWENGRFEPQPHKRPKLAKLLRVSPNRLEELLTSSSPTLPVTERSQSSKESTIVPSKTTAFARLDDRYVESIRSRIQELVRMDMQFGGDYSSNIALNLFRSSVRKLGKAEMSPTIESDLYSAIGELGELTGWLLFDTQKHDLVRKVNNEALHLLRMAGDRSNEILTLQNMSMHAGFLNRATEAKHLADMVLETNRLSPRLRALFLTRKARALALGGDDSSAIRTFEMATSLHLEGVRDNDPGWTWWITNEELAWHRAMIYSDSGNWHTAVDLFEESVAGMAPHAVRGRYIHLASLLEAQVQARNWANLPSTIDSIIPYVDEVGSKRAASMLHKATSAITHVCFVPNSVQESVAQLNHTLIEAGYSPHLDYATND